MIRNLGAQDRIPGAQKAAILLVLLGEEVSAEVLRQLTAQEVELIAKEVAQLGAISEEVAQKVLQECHEMRLAHHYLVKGGLEYAEKLLVKAFGPEKGRRLVEQLAARLGAELTSLDALRRFDPQQLAKFLHQEHPQTIALVLSHLTPTQAATLLASLPEHLRADVAMRMAHLDQISPEVVQKIGAVIGQKMKALGEFSRETYGGVQAVADIMNQLDATTSKEVLEKIEERDPKLAEEIRHLMFVFEDLLLLSQEAIKEILARIDRRLLTVALKGTSDKLKEHIMSCMSQRGAEMLREDMEALGPVKIREVEAAQQQIIAVVRQLEAEGIISLRGSVGEQYVV